MPKITFKKDEAPIMVPGFVSQDVIAWINEPEMTESLDAEGKPILDAEGKTVKVPMIGEDGKPVLKNLNEKAVGKNAAKIYAQLTSPDVEQIKGSDLGLDAKDPNYNRVMVIRGKDIEARIEIASAKIDEKTYRDEYVTLFARTLKGTQILMEDIGSVSYADTFDKNGNPEKIYQIPTGSVNEKELPSVAKYFNQGFGILARNSAAARVRSKVEGPDKALQSAARDLMRARGWSFEKAYAKIKLMAAED